MEADKDEVIIGGKDKILSDLMDFVQYKDTMIPTSRLTQDM